MWTTTDKPRRTEDMAGVQVIEVKSEPTFKVCSVLPLAGLGKIGNTCWSGRLG